jgi:membrane-associated protease RseP (regulator of RpoE activity)
LRYRKHLIGKALTSGAVARTEARGTVTRFDAIHRRFYHLIVSTLSSNNARRSLVFLALVALLLAAALVWMAVRERQAAPATPLQNAARELMQDPLQFATNRFKGGIGAALVIDVVTATPKVSAVIAGSPAEAAGLKADDFLLEVNGEPTSGKTLGAVVDMIRGWTVADVSILVRRDGTNVTCEVSRTSWNKLRELGKFR